MPLRIVLDTTVLISAIRSRNGASALLVQLALERQFVLLMDLALILEYREVAMRSHHTSVSHFTEDESVRLIWTLENTAEPVEIVQKHRPLSVDPGDDHISGIGDQRQRKYHRHDKSEAYPRSGFTVQHSSD